MRSNEVAARPRRRPQLAVLAIAAALVAAAGCGGSETATPDLTTASSGPGASVAPDPAPGTTSRPPSSASPQWQAARVSSGGAEVIVACRGEGSPAVLLMAPLATSSADAWVRTPVPDEVAGRTKVCVYDRPGIGQSVESGVEPSVPAEVERLDAIIEQGGVGSPVVLVSEGYSTFIARAYAGEQLEKVAGMVLVDPPLWPLVVTRPDDATPAQTREYDSVAELNDELGRYGAAALPPPPVPTLILGVDADLPARPAGSSGTATTSPEGTATATTAPTGAPEPPTKRRQALQRELAQKSPFGRFQGVEGSGVEVQWWKPAVLVEAIR
jgi:pimeloyl-ACP methyl ester carboxylesterase